MNVLSLFDGMSCGQIALERANIKIDNYYASEIDKYAIKITQKNYPNTIQLGDINNWKEWNLSRIDLLVGGSPCQGFSIAGQGLNFDDPRSKLFFEYVDILNYYKPKYFLLENVKMKKEWQNIITEYLGVEAILINSALVSAQSRKRLYWTNIGNIQQPEDKNIYLKDIIETGDVDRDKSYCIDANYWKGGNLKRYYDKSIRQLIIEKPHQSSKRLMVKIGNIYPGEGQNGNIYSTEGKSPSLSAGIGITGKGIGSSNAPKINKLNSIQIGSLYENNAQAGRIYSTEGKSVTLKGEAGGLGAKTGLYSNDMITWRKLTPLECERLQTVPENYTEGVSNTQRYKMLGNGWTIDVIAHIFNYLPLEYKND